MNNRLTNLFMFAVGAAIGSAVTWKLLKTKYEQIAQEEIDSVKETFSRRTEIEPEPETETNSSDILKGVLERLNTANDNLDKIASYKEKLEGVGYVNYAHVEKKEKEDDEIMDDPYVISPDEFGDAFDYDTISLTYYKDGVLANDWDEVIENIDEVVGLESLEHFGEYEDDSVFVRNNRLKTEYEILRDNRKFSDVVKDSDRAD